MKKLLLCLSMIAAGKYNLMACEACGCAASNPYFGLLLEFFIKIYKFKEEFNSNKYQFE